MKTINSKLIRVGVDDTVTRRVPLKPGLMVLSCTSKNPAVATCSRTRSTFSVTGQSPGITKVCVIVGIGNRPLMQFVYGVQVIEQDEE